MTTIVYCNPSPKSFNHAILKSITDSLTDLGQEYFVIDLYADCFDPAPEADDAANQVLVKRYQKALADASKVILIFPIWWGMMPAMLKGWIDCTFEKGVIYDFTPEGNMMPCLSVDKTMIITTAEEPMTLLAPFVSGYFAPQVLNAVGLNNVSWQHCDRVSTGSDEHRKEFLATVTAEALR